MQVNLATDPGSASWPNEDFAAVAPGAAVVLDGCTTVPRDADLGCSHGVAWYAAALGTALLAAIAATPPVPLAEALNRAITEVRGRHAGTCDLANPRSPASTVTAARVTPGQLEYLTLSDSFVIADYGDDRELVILTDGHRAARADPGAAAQALAGSLPLDGLRGVALLSDGAARIVDIYHLLSWPEAIRVLREDGPAALIAQVRAAEASDPDGSRWRRFKLADDVTALWWPLDG
jgi:hypothetical protein